MAHELWTAVKYLYAFIAAIFYAALVSCIEPCASYARYDEYNIYIGGEKKKKKKKKRKQNKIIIIYTDDIISHPDYNNIFSGVSRFFFFLYSAGSKPVYLRAFNPPDYKRRSPRAIAPRCRPFGAATARNVSPRAYTGPPTGRTHEGDLFIARACVSTSSLSRTGRRTFYTFFHAVDDVSLRYDVDVVRLVHTRARARSPAVVVFCKREKNSIINNHLSSTRPLYARA